MVTLFLTGCAASISENASEKVGKIEVGTTVSTGSKSKLIEFEKYALERNISIEIAKNIWAHLDETEARELVDYLSNFTILNYVPESIRDIVPENYGKEITENIVSGLSSAIILDEKFSEEERKALEILYSLDSRKCRVVHSRKRI